MARGRRRRAGWPYAAISGDFGFPARDWHRHGGFATC